MNEIIYPSFVFFMDGRRNRDPQRLYASMEDAGKFVRSSLRNNIDPCRNSNNAHNNNRPNSSMDAGKSKASRFTKAAAATGLSKLTDGLRFSRINLTERSKSKTLSNDGKTKSHKTTTSSRKDLLEKAYKYGCSLDAGLSGGSLGKHLNPGVMAPIKAPAKVSDLNPRKSVELAMVDLYGPEYLPGKADADSRVTAGEERIWEAMKRSTRGGLRSVHVETDDVEYVAEEVNARVKAADMASNMQVHAFRCARKQIDTQQSFSSKQTASALKKEFDGAYGPAWHCIVGMSFGSFVTHSDGGFLYFTIDKISVLLFKTAMERID